MGWEGKTRNWPEPAWSSVLRLLAFGALRAGGNLAPRISPCLRARWRGSRSPLDFFFKPDKGFLTSPDGAGGGAGVSRHAPPLRPGPWPPHHCAAPRPQPRLRGSPFLTFHPSGLKTVRHVRQTVTLDLGPAIQKPLTPDCDIRPLLMVIRPQTVTPDPKL